MRGFRGAGRSGVECGWAVVVVQPHGHSTNGHGVPSRSTSMREEAGRACRGGCATETSAPRLPKRMRRSSRGCSSLCISLCLSSVRPAECEKAGSPFSCSRRTSFTMPTSSRDRISDLAGNCLPASRDCAARREPRRQAHVRCAKTAGWGSSVSGQRSGVWKTVQRRRTEREEGGKKGSTHHPLPLFLTQYLRTLVFRLSQGMRPRSARLAHHDVRDALTAFLDLVLFVRGKSRTFAKPGGTFGSERSALTAWIGLVVRMLLAR